MSSRYDDLDDGLGTLPSEPPARRTFVPPAHTAPPAPAPMPAWTPPAPPPAPVPDPHATVQLPPVSAPPAPPPPRPPVSAPPRSPQPHPVPQGSTEPPHSGSRWALALLAACSVLCCWAYGVGIAVAIVGIVMSRVLKKQYQNAGQPVPADMKAWGIVSVVGLILSVFGTILGILFHIGTMMSPGDTGM